MRVLVVEDEPDLLRTIAQVLREDGYAVDEAADGQEGLYKATSWSYDAIVLDVILPGIDGFELIAQVRQDPSLRAIPIICLSGYGGHIYEQRAEAAGCD